jgi:hypothetical protein
MKFWNRLRWIGSAVFIVAALLTVAVALLDRLPESEAAARPEPGAAPSVPSGNNRGL